KLCVGNDDSYALSWFKIARIVALASRIRVMRWKKRNRKLDARLFQDASYCERIKSLRCDARNGRNGRN
ncbi:hypothetical protein Tco_0334196, partial [Tanacetum coccineum]